MYFIVQNNNRAFARERGLKMILAQEQKRISTSVVAAEVFRAVLAMRPEEDQHKEHFYIIGLNAQNIVLFVDLVTMGTINSACPMIRECFRLALMKDAVSIIAGHNHPGGTDAPSPQDRIFTQKLREAGDLLGIKLLDHIIIGNSFYSFADNGNL